MDLENLLQMSEVFFGLAVPGFGVRDGILLIVYFLRVEKHCFFEFMNE